MLRASSGKHARLVGVCPAGGDSVPLHRFTGVLFFLAGFSPGDSVSTSPNISQNRWFLSGMRSPRLRSKPHLSTENVDSEGALWGPLGPKILDLLRRKKIM